MKRELLNNRIIRQAFGVLLSIMMLIPVFAWGQDGQSGGGSSSSGSQSTVISTKDKAVIEQNTLALPKTILTKGTPIIQTRAGGNTASQDSLVKIIDANGSTSNAMGWNTAFNQIQPGESIQLYQNVTLTNTLHVLPAEDCTIDGQGYELHYTENGADKTLILDADITFKNIKLYNGLVAWGHKVVFESDVVLSNNYSVWGGEFRTQEQMENSYENRKNYRVENTSITIKGGTFNKIYGGSSDGEITGSTYVMIEGGIFNEIYGGNSSSDAKAIPGNTKVIISGGTINDNVFGASLYGEVKGTANLTISGNPTLSKFVFGGSSAADATVNNVNVNIEGGTFNNGYWVFGGNNLAPVTGTITMNISGGTFNGYLACGGNDAGATAENTSLTITGGTFNKWIYGGGYAGNVTQTAKTDISDGTFGGSILGGGASAASTCGNTDMTLSNVALGDNTWVYGGGELGSVTGTAKVTVKSGTINNSVFGGAGGWDTNASCGNTEVVIEGGTIGWVYGGGDGGSVSETAKVTMSAGTINGNIYGGGYNGTCGKTEVYINTSSTVQTVYGGGENGTVANDTQVTIENGQFTFGVYGSGQASTATVGGNVNIIAKGGSTQLLGAANTTSSSSSITGTMNITIEGGKTSFTGSAQIISGNTANGIYKDCTLSFKNCGTDASPYTIPTVYGISKIVMNNSFISKSPTGQANPAFMHNLSNPLIIEGTGMKGSFEIQAYGGQATIGTTIVTATDLTTGATFTTNGYSLYKAGNTYRYGGTSPDYKTVNITRPDAAIGTLSVKLSDGTELNSGDQVPANTELTIATTAIAGNALTVKNGNNTITGGTLTVNADVNLTVAISGSLNLAEHSTDITISKTGDQWQYLASDFKSTGIAFNGIVTGTLPDNKTILIDGSAKGELTFDNAKVDAGSTGTAITIAQGAEISIKGSLEAKTADSSAPAIANNGNVTTATGASITATNSGDNTKGISISDGAALLLTDGSTLTASGIDNSTGGTVVAQEGSTVSNSTSGGSDLLKSHDVTITNPGNGNALIVKAGDINVTSGDKVTENTKLTITATPAANYSLEKIIVTPGNGSATEIANNGDYTMGTAAITISASFKYNPPYIPVPTYYTVTLPEVEGATLSKQAGSHTVEEGYSFTFTLTLDEDYSESVPVVTTDRGETLAPAANGKYTIRNVEEDIVVSISGIVKNTPTAIEGVEAGTKVWAARGTLFIRSSAAQQAEVFSLTGISIRRLGIPAGDTEVGGLQAGIYIVRLTDGTVVKALIGRR